MTFFNTKLADVVKRDPRYAYEAYEFVFQALHQTQKLLGRAQPEGAEPAAPGEPQHHVSGPELLEGVRLLALQEFGLMARTVFRLWGINCTDDFGAIVFNLVEAELMSKTSDDNQDDFHDVYDLDKVLVDEYRIAVSEQAAMVFPRARLVVSACLFLAWLGFLLYLVIQNEHMIVLSRPQFLAAPVCVIAELSEQEGRPQTQAAVVTVVWADGAQPPARIEVRSLEAIGAREGYQGPGRYLLALTPLGPDHPDRFELVAVPALGQRELRIYPVTRETEHQLEEIKRLRGK